MSLNDARMPSLSDKLNAQDEVVEQVEVVEAEAKPQKVKKAKKSK